MMQITDLEKEQQITPVLRLGFRPFFLFGAIFGTLAILLWVLMLRNVVSISPLGGMHWWHIHEMVFGFGCAITVGFLLTAVQNWTGLKSIQGNPLLLLTALWATGRILVLFPAVLGNTITMLVDISFLPIAAYLLGKPIVAIKQYRNLFFVPLLLLFTLANLEMYMSLSFPDIFSYRPSSYTGVVLILLLMSVMSGRVVPMFTANGTNTPKATPSPLLDKLTNIPLAITMFMLLLHPIFTFNTKVFGCFLIFAGVFQTIRWLRWKPWITLGTPLVWALHSALKFISFGLILLGISYFVAEIPSNHIWHLLTIGGIGGLILAMTSRVSLGHTGRPLTPPKTMSFAFLCIAISATVRAFGPWGFPGKTAMFIDLSALLWIIAFGIFIFHYGPMLMSTRADKRPG
jgi:uncharacterized protein involved in response to NO